MARSPKSESLTIRLDPKTRFMLEYVARLRGQTITTVVERAISLAADAATISRENPFSNETDTKSWRSFWDVNEGVRALKIARESELHPTYEEERRLDFARKHWPFFFTTSDCIHLMPAYIEILWPRIDEFIETQEAHRSDDFFAGGKAMQQALKDANVKAPEWPVQPKPMTTGRRPSQAAPAFESGGIDDDIPF